jgi:hypothetical protein
MGGTSTSSQTSESQTTPWGPATDALKGILGGVNGLVPQAGNNATTNAATSQLLSNFGAGNPFAGAMGNVASGLLGGGGANANSDAIGGNLAAYKGMLSPLASNTNYNPMDTPGFKDALAATTADITNNVNSQFAAAGRDGSPGNLQALGRGIAQGVAPTIAAQYNTNVANQQGAAGNLYNAGNSTYGLLNGNQAQANANALNGFGAAGTALDARNWGPNGILSTAANAFNLPASNYATLLGMVSPVAQAFGKTSGSGTGTQTMSGAQQFATLGQGAAGFGKFLWG